MAYYKHVPLLTHAVSNTHLYYRTKCAEVDATEDHEDEDLFLTPACTPGEETEEKFVFPDKREESIANAEGQLLDEFGNTEALLYSKMYDKYAFYLRTFSLF